MAKSLEHTGAFLNAKYKQMFEKAGVDKGGRPVTRVSLRVVYYPKGAAQEETRSTFISVPPGFQLPTLVADEVYTFPVDITGGKDRAVYFSLNTHVPIMPDDN